MGHRPLPSIRGNSTVVSDCFLFLLDLKVYFVYIVFLMINWKVNSRFDLILTNCDKQYLDYLKLLNLLRTLNKIGGFKIVLSIIIHSNYYLLKIFALY